MVGCTRSHAIVARLRELGWGRMFVGKPTPYEVEPWGLDNGAFAAWKTGKAFDPARFAEKAHEWATLRPMFGVLPDVVGGGASSLSLSLEWLPRMPPSVPWYLAVQDGIEPRHVEGVTGIAGIFVGGTDAYKGSVFQWAPWAHARQLRCHYARVASPMLVRRAYDAGADSCDSTQPLWSRNEWAKFERAVFQTERQATLW